MKRRLELTSEAIGLVAARFKVLGEPFRLRIIQLLQTGEMTIGEMTDALGASQPNVSKHIRILQEAGLVSRREEGDTVYCSIADATVFELCEVVCSSLRQRMMEQTQALSIVRRTSLHTGAPDSY